LLRAQLALPFEDRERSQSFGDRYQVRGIPNLVLLDEGGDLITVEGRAKVRTRVCEEITLALLTR
jgi:hypothetical protein